MKKILMLFLLLHLSLGIAAEVLLTATTDKTALTLDDEVTLTVRLSGVKGNLVMPQLPSLPAFNVYSREVEQSSVNGQTAFTFRYTMVPRFVGQTTIGAITFNYEGKTYKTSPIEIRIYRSTGTPQLPLPNPNTQPGTAEVTQAPAQTPQTNALPPLEAALAAQAQTLGTQPFFMVAAVSNRTPYIGEQITLAVRFYFSKNFYDAPYQKPTVSNIFIEDGPSAEGTQIIHDTLYRYQEQRYFLMGAAAGPATVGAATVTYHTGSSPLSAFDRLFGGAAISEEQTAASLPITLTIKALPPGKPDSFYGAVGRGYTFKSSVQPQTAEAGEAVNWTATVYGMSNLKSTRDLNFPAIEGFKSYPAAASSGQTRGTPALDYKTFKTVLVPSASGIYTVPALEWSYFNPVTKKYYTLKTDPVSLTITPSTKQSSGFDFSAGQPAGTGFQTLGQDVRYLKTSYAPAPNWLAKLAAWRVGNVLALVWLGCCVLFASFGRKSLAQRKAFLTAKSHLKKATMHTEVAEAVSAYLQQKFKINTGSLPLKDVVNRLQQQGVRHASAEAFSLLWQRLDAARFAPGELSTQSTLDLSAQALDVLALMEEETK